MQKTGFMIFVIVIPKQGLACTSPAKPLFGMTTLGQIVIRCLLSVCFYDAMHGIYASYFLNIGFTLHLMFTKYEA